MLTENEKKELLGIARSSIRNEFFKKKEGTEPPESKILRAKSGAFVTLHTKSGELRGCIGMMQASAPLYETVSEMALEAAFGDPRFDRLKEEELEEIVIEISVLSPFKRIKDPKEIVLGKHGVMVKSGHNSGVFLPQVATETGWSLEEFMSNLCAGKAGIPSDAWKTGNAELYTFEAEIISEKR